MSGHRPEQHRRLIVLEHDSVLVAIDLDMITDAIKLRPFRRDLSKGAGQPASLRLALGLALTRRGRSGCRGRGGGGGGGEQGARGGRRGEVGKHHSQRCCRCCRSLAGGRAERHREMGGGDGLARGHAVCLAPPGGRRDRAAGRQLAPPGLRRRASASSGGRASDVRFSQRVELFANAADVRLRRAGLWHHGARRHWMCAVACQKRCWAIQEIVQSVPNVSTVPPTHLCEGFLQLLDLVVLRIHQVRRHLQPRILERACELRREGRARGAPSGAEAREGGTAHAGMAPWRRSPRALPCRARPAQLAGLACQRPAAAGPVQSLESTRAASRSPPPARPCS